MRIALLSNTADPKDGYGNITVELTHALHAAGLDCTLFLPRSQATSQVVSFPFPVRYILPEYIYRLYQPKGLRYMLPIHIKEFDLIHSLFAFPYCIVASLASIRSGIPFVMGAQGTHGVRPLIWHPERWVLNWCYKRARGIAVPSDYTKSKILELSKASFDIDIIHNGVRFDRFKNDPGSTVVRQMYPKKKLLVTVGGLWGRKGQDCIIRALPAVLKKHPDTVYLMVGEGNAKEKLQKLAHELGVADAVHFAGRKSGNELVSYFHACDVYVHTPRITPDVKFEGFGIVYLEASACGKPIVATDAGGIHDAVLDGETGLISSEGDIAGIANNIVQLLDNKELSQKLGTAGREYAKAHDWNLIAKKYVQFYEQATHN